MRSHSAAIRGRPVVWAAATTVAVLGLLGVGPAHAGSPPSGEGTVIEGTRLRLVSLGDPARMSALGPGDNVDWVVGVVSREAGAAVARTLHASPTGLDLTVTIDACDHRWTTASCPGSIRLVTAAPLPTGQDTSLDLGVQHATASWLRIRVSPAPDTPAGAGVRTLTLVATSSGESVQTTVGDQTATAPPQTTELAATGVRAAATLALAAVLVMAGWTLRRVASGVRRSP